MVVDAVDLMAPASRFVCVLGPSGCGKTTLLRLIAGFETADEGRIVQEGKDVTALPPEARDYGIVFQSYALFPNRTVAANVSFGLEATGVPRAARDKRVDELLKLVGLAEHAAKYRTRYQAASSSAWRWLAHLPSRPAYCFSTSRFQPSMQMYGRTCAMN